MVVTDNNLSRLQMGLGDWTCGLEIDTSPGRDRAKRMYHRHVTDLPDLPPSNSSIQVFLQNRETPFVRLTSQGRPVSLLELIRMGPEWEHRFQRLPDPSRALLVDSAFSESPTLESVEDGFLILQPECWALYIFFSMLGLFLREQPLFTLHSAVCGAHDRAMVLVGSSGAGKSTLSWALHASGADYFGDELAFFHLPDYRLEVLKRAVHLRPGGIESLGTGVQEGVWNGADADDPKYIINLPEPERPCPKDRASLFFIEGFTERPGIHPIASGEAVRRLLRGIGYRNPSIPERLKIAAGLTNRYPCWSLNVGRPKDTAEFLIRHVGALT
jgi:hypothetical protein